MFTLKEQKNGWTFGVQDGSKFVPVTNKTYFSKGNAKRGLKSMLKKQMKQLNKSSKRGRKAKK